MRIKLTFNINYHTRWGQSLYICGSIPQLGDNNPHKAPQMEMTGRDVWSITLQLNRLDKDFDYYFIVKADNEEWRFEWGKPHRFVVGKGLSDVDISCQWQDMPSDKPFYSTAFTQGILNRLLKDQPLKAVPKTLCFRVKAPMVAPDELLAICGSCDALGNWNPKQAVRMNDAHYPVWEANIQLNTLPACPFEYKFVVIDRKTLRTRRWEACENRWYGIGRHTSNSRIELNGLRFVNDFHWKGAGTAIPVFSLRTADDFGVGDFMDIKKMVDWCVTTGQKVLQILPVNDTTITKTWLDSYPYRANSTFALHPMYMRLEKAGKLKTKKRRDYFSNMAKKLNELEAIDYEKVTSGKLEYLKELYSETGTCTEHSDDYKRFVAANDYWLLPYASWCVLRDEHNTADNTHWGDMSVYDEKKVKAYCQKHDAEVGMYYFIQYHLDKQLREVRDYAHQNGIILKGDIPIGIGRESVDAWQHPSLFNMNSQAGAPPDDFSILGQNWGFPTYNWDEMSRDSFAWWKNRFRKMAEYFDAYRIDHILGFFRIWEIPLSQVHGLLGYFNPALPLSPQEMYSKFGFLFDRDKMTVPALYEWMLSDFFMQNTALVKEKYLHQLNDGRYVLRPEFDTQQKIEAYFQSIEQTDENRSIRSALMGMVDNVLFIEDPYKPGYYHPRITSQYSYLYRTLSEQDKNCFNSLYNDFFYHRNDQFWKGKAMWKLPPLINSTGMLTCAEDLGMIPACVPDVMHKLEILSLEIQRMSKNPNEVFGNTAHYPYYSVCTTSTHDMSGIRAWWEENREATQRFYNDVLHYEGDAPQYAEPYICSDIIQKHLESPSMLCILPLQDWLATDGDIRREYPASERINDPSNPRHYWRYRMHLSIETLLNCNSFNATLRNRINSTAR